jgi:hypothetical protein
MARDELNHFFFHSLGRNPVCDGRGQAAFAVMFGVPGIHSVQVTLGLFDDGVVGLKLFQIDIGDDRRDFNRDFFFDVQAGHFHIDPQELFHGEIVVQVEVKFNRKIPDEKQRMRSGFTSAFTFMFTITFTLFAASAARAALTSASRDVLETASHLGTEGEASRIRKELEALPRAKVIAAVREGLNEGAPFSIVAARTANALHLTEVSVDLEKAFAKNDDWNTALALAAVASESQKSNLAVTWQSKLPTYDSPTRIAILQTLAEWGYGLSSEKYDQLLNDESAQVRIATVRNFAVQR